MAQVQPTKVKKRKKSVIKRANTTRVRTSMKRLRAAIAAKDTASAANLLRPTLSAIDRAISKGVLEENTGNRYKSRLSLAVNVLSAAAKA
jgi:small subunit ribosomal protein S20